MGYPKTVYDNAWNKLQRRREQARDQARAHREEIHGRIPAVKILEREMAATAASVTKAVITSPDKADSLIADLARQNLQLQARREELLRESGYPADYLREAYTCGQCCDSGYRGIEMCACFRELLRQEAFAQLGAATGDSTTFESFSLEAYPASPDGSGVIPRDRMRGILGECRQYAEEFGPASPSLLMQGSTGLGKTHLSMSIAGRVTQRGYGVVYIPVQRLMDRLEAEKFSRNYDAKEQYTESLCTALDCDLLVLDDLGTEFSNQFTNYALYNILNTRLMDRRATIISTNLTLPEMEGKYSPRIVSRLICDYRVLRFFGKDIRYIRRTQGIL